MHSEKLLWRYSETVSTIKRMIGPFWEKEIDAELEMEHLFTVLEEVELICTWPVYRDADDWLLLRSRLRVYCSMLKRLKNKKSLT